MAEDEAGYTDIPDQWIQQFKSVVNADPTARGAWKDIENAGIEKGALLLLWGWAGGASKDMDAMHNRAWNSSRLLKALIREEKIFRAKPPKKAHDRDLFRQRARKAREAAMRSNWAIPTREIPTLRDELAKVKEEIGREPSPAAVRKAIVKAAGERSPLKQFYFPFLLQAYAKRYGVELGIKRLVALASCANPGTLVDEGTVGRYLRSIPKAVRNGILRDTLPDLPPPERQKS